MVQVNWTEQAVSDLKNIYDYISKDSHFYAAREVGKIKLRTDYIKLFINSGRMVPELNEDSVRELIEGRYRIVYKVLSQTEVHILTIHHSSRKDFQLY